MTVEWNSKTLQTYGKRCRYCSACLSFFRQRKGFCLDCETTFKKIASAFAVYALVVIGGLVLLFKHL